MAKGYMFRLSVTSCVLLAKINKNGGFLKYGEAAALMGADPTPVEMKIDGKILALKAPDNSWSSSPIFQEFL